MALGRGPEGQPVQIISTGYAAEMQVTPAASAYSANDVMGTAQQLAFGGPGGEFFITSTKLWVYHTAVISGETSYNLHLYNVTPPSAHADNDAWDLPSGDRASYIGFLSMGTPVDIGSSLFVQQEAVNKQITLPNNGLIYGELVTVGAFTATAAIRRVRIHGVYL